MRTLVVNDLADGVEKREGNVSTYRNFGAVTSELRC